MILRGRCSDLASLFRGRRSTLDRLSGKITKRMEVSQNCFVFDAVKLKNCGSPAELLSTSNIEEVSHKCCIFKLADRQVDR